MDDQTRRNIDALRFRWHELVLKDPYLTKHPVALKLAGFVMHRFVSKNNCAEFSFDMAAECLSVAKRSVIRARNVLVKRGWLQIKAKPQGRTRYWSATKYSLSGGPDDLIIGDAKDDAHVTSPAVTVETVEQ
jgi:hypothetical protein